jgi:hypothetical protein
LNHRRFGSAWTGWIVVVSLLALAVTTWRAPAAGFVAARL